MFQELDYELMDELEQEYEDPLEVRALQLDSAWEVADDLEELESDLIDPGADYQVIPPDTRRPISNTRKVPFRYICKLEIRSTSGNRVCTGTLVGPNKVLTAAHCLKRPGVVAGGVRVIPGKRGPGTSRRSEPFGSARGARLHIPGAHRIAGDPFDYAVITLDRPIGRRVGWWRRVRAWSDDRVLNRSSNTAGYPVDKNPRGDHLYWTYNRHVLVRGPRMEYFHDTFGGQSGSPIWIRWRDARSIVGIHSDRDDSRTPVVANIGVHITPRILSDIQRWLRS